MGRASKVRVKKYLIRFFTFVPYKKNPGFASQAYLILQHLSGQNAHVPINTPIEYSLAQPGLLEDSIHRQPVFLIVIQAVVVENHGRTDFYVPYFFIRKYKEISL